MTHKQDRATEILHRLKRTYPKAKCSLDFENPFQLLVATILSAQSTDAKVNEVAKGLFKRYPDPLALASARPYDIEAMIKSTGYYRNKAKLIQGAAAEILARHDGKVPDTMEALTELPGVGRKTANVVLANAFGKPEGVVVDTHVGRLANRLGLTRHDDAAKIEADLMKLIPRNEWTKFSHRLIVHGREVCLARKPRCSECLLNEFCPSATDPLE
jgi:endonuclease-3